MHAAGNRPAQSLDLARVGDDQVLDAVPLLFSAVVALLSVWVLGAAHRTFHPVQHKFQARTRRQHLLQIRRSARRQLHPPSQGFFQNRREPVDPPVDFRLVEAKQQPHDFLQRIELEIHQNEQQFVADAAQLSLTARAQGTDASSAPLGQAPPLCLEPLLLKRKHNCSSSLRFSEVAARSNRGWSTFSQCSCCFFTPK
jgi:hypothetical protein